jgi:tryptophan synthase alpha chain
MDLTAYIRRRRRPDAPLLMTHIVIGYPSMEASYALVAEMVNAGVELMELQIPFSEPIADGPVILRANQEALAAGATVAGCLDFARRAAADFSIPFLFMSYYNILYKFGVESLVEQMADMGLAGAIVPDLPPEEGGAYLQAMAAHDLNPVLILAPTSSEARLTMLTRHARGMVYCVARKGVTGADTDFTAALEDYLARCRRCTDLPLAVGFGVKQRSDIAFLKDRAEVAVIGTETIRRYDVGGLAAVRSFIEGLR